MPYEEVVIIDRHTCVESLVMDRQTHIPSRCECFTLHPSGGSTRVHTTTTADDHILIVVRYIPVVSRSPPHQGSPQSHPPRMQRAWHDDKRGQALVQLAQRGLHAIHASRTSLFLRQIMG